MFEEDDIFAKLKIESEFQKLSPGGATSYVEISDVEDDKDKVMELINFIYNNMMYVEVNTKNDYCQKNGFSGELIIDDDLD